MNKVLEEFSKIGIIPVIALDHVEEPHLWQRLYVTAVFRVLRLPSVPLLLRSPSASCPSSSRRC